MAGRFSLNFVGLHRSASAQILRIEQERAFCFFLRQIKYVVYFNMIALNLLLVARRFFFTFLQLS